MYSEDWMKITAQEVLEENEYNRKRFAGVNHRKYRGAVTVHKIRKILKEFYNVSDINVYIEGLEHIEFDLLVLDRSVDPKNRYLFHPSEVKKVIEIKTWGAFGKDSLEKVKSDMKQVKEICPFADLHVLSVVLNQNYKYRLTNENTGVEVSYMFLGKGVKKGKDIREYNPDWHKKLLV